MKNDKVITFNNSRKRPLSSNKLEIKPMKKQEYHFTPRSLKIPIAPRNNYIPHGLGSFEFLKPSESVLSGEALYTTLIIHITMNSIDAVKKLLLESDINESKKYVRAAIMDIDLNNTQMIDLLKKFI